MNMMLFGLRLSYISNIWVRELDPATQINSLRPLTGKTLRWGLPYSLKVCAGELEMAQVSGYGQTDKG